MKPLNKQEVFIPIKEHSEFKVIEGGIGLQNVYPQELYTFTEEQLKELLGEVFEESRRQHAWAGGNIYGEGEYAEEQDLTNFKYSKQELIKQLLQ